MAIFQNEAIRSLPEQVQKNKEDIKNINDILENIDPDQVATILSDIASIKAEQVVQNTAIGSNTGNITANTTAINNEKDTRESVVGVNSVGNTYLKTATPNKQILINNNGLVSISSSNNNVEITAPSGHVRMSTDNSSVIADDVNGVSLSTNESDVPNLVILRPNGDFEVSNEHTLKFDTTGSLTIDGTPVGGGGGGTQLYQHNINIYCSTLKIRMCTNLITSQSEAFTFATLRNYLQNKGYTGVNQLLMASGRVDANNILGIYGGTNSINYRLFTGANGSFGANDVTDLFDLVVAL